jgi:YHS domain-containing protein
MSISTDTQHTHPVNFNDPNWIAADPLPRDKEQSHRLHEPDHLINTIDPITGRDIDDVSGHPSIVDGNLTIYFESEKSYKAYQDMPINHPCSRSTGEPSEDMDRGG